VAESFFLPRYFFETVLHTGHVSVTDYPSLFYEAIFTDPLDRDAS